MVIGFLLTGIFSPYNLITPYSILLKSADSHNQKKFDKDQVKDLVSGLFNSFYAIGGITGPIFGGYVNEHTNFRTTSDL